MTLRPSSLSRTRNFELPQFQFTCKVVGTIPKQVFQIQLQTREKTVGTQKKLHFEHLFVVPLTLSQKLSRRFPCGDIQVIEVTDVVYEEKATVCPVNPSGNSHAAPQSTGAIQQCCFSLSGLQLFRGETSQFHLVEDTTCVTTDTGLDQIEDPEDCLSGSRFSSVVWL